MSHQQLFRRGTSSQLGVYTPGTTEIVADTTSIALRIGDSSQLGGYPIHKFAAAVTTLSQYAVVYAATTTTLNNLSGDGVLKLSTSGIPSVMNGATSRITFWSDANTLSSNAGFTYDGTDFTQITGSTLLGTGTFPSSTIGLNGSRAGIISGTEDSYLVVANMQSGTGADRGGQIWLGARGTTATADLARIKLIGARESATSANFTTYFAIHTTIADGTIVEKWRFTSAGILQSNSAQTIQSSSGILTVTGTGGLTLTSGTNNTILTQNSVNVFTSEGSGAVVNTLYLKAGKVGIAKTNPGDTLDVAGSATAYSLSLVGNPNITYTNTPTAGNAVFFDNTLNGSLIYFRNSVATPGDTYSLSISAGKIGINLVSASVPGAPVTIGVAAAGVDGEAIRFNRTDDALRYNSMYSVSSSAGASSNKLSFKLHDTGSGTSQTTVMTLQGNGNVGIGTTGPTALLHVGLAGTTLGTIGIAGNTSGLVTLTVAAAAGTWTMKLPTGVAGTAGFQLTDAAGDGVTSWASAASTKDAKNIITQYKNTKDALNKILSASVYSFKYKEGMGTGDLNTEYVGIMAEESPWAMHFNNKILNPVSTFGYTVLAIKELNKEIQDLKNEIKELKK